MKSVYYITAFLSIILIIGLVYIAFFNVYQTDDYIYAYTTKKFGILGNMQESYMNWGGRYFGYTYNMFVPLSDDPENILPKIYPVFLILSFIGVSALNFQKANNNLVDFFFALTVLRIYYEQYRKTV